MAIEKGQFLGGFTSLDQPSRGIATYRDLVVETWDEMTGFYPEQEIKTVITFEPLDDFEGVILPVDEVDVERVPETINDNS